MSIEEIKPPDKIGKWEPKYQWTREKLDIAVRCLRDGSPALVEDRLCDGQAEAIKISDSLATAVRDRTDHVGIIGWEVNTVRWYMENGYAFDTNLREIPYRNREKFIPGIRPGTIEDDPETVATMLRQGVKRWNEITARKGHVPKSPPWLPGA